MVIKHFDPKNGECYFWGDEIKVKKLHLWDTAHKATSEEAKEELELAILKRVYELIQSSTWRDAGFNIVSNSLEFTDCIAVLVKNNKESTNVVYIFPDVTFLMSDRGTTIERLI